MQWIFCDYKGIFLTDGLEWLLGIAFFDPSGI